MTDAANDDHTVNPHHKTVFWSWMISVAANDYHTVSLHHNTVLLLNIIGDKCCRSRPSVNPNHIIVHRPCRIGYR